MFHRSKTLPVKLVLTLVMALLLNSILLTAPNLASTVQAQTFDLVVRVAGPIYVQSGQNLTYELTVHNLSSKVFTNIVFYNDLPVNTTHVSGGTLVTDNGPAYVQFTLPTLAANTTQTVTWVAKANNVAVGTVINNNSFGLISSAPEANQGGGGPVSTLVEAPGTLTAVFKDQNGLAFDVKVDGFQFQNYTNEAPRNFGDDLGADDLFLLFGPAACQSGTTAATCKLSGPAQKWLEGQISGMGGGHCEGMAATSLRLFEWLPFKGKSSPASFQSGAGTTIDLNFPAQSLENYIAHYFITQSVDEYYNSANEITLGPVAAVNKLIADFNRADPIPYTVGIYALPGWKHGHAITAYGVETVSPSESRILVYDNNFPKQRQYITVNMAANTWRYVTAATPGEDDTIYEGTATSGNLSLHANNSRDLPAGQYFTCPFCNQPAGNASVQAAAAGMVTGEISFQYSGEGAILVVNDAGQKTGNDIGSDILLEEIPGAELIHFRGGLGKDIPPRISVPFTATDETLYTVMVHGTTVETPTHGSLSITGYGFHMGLDNIELGPGEVFDFRVSPDGNHISFWVSGTVTGTVMAPAMHIAHDPIHVGDPSVVFEVSGETLIAGERISMTLEPALERIYIEDEGIEEEEFNITMDLIFPDGDTHVYTDTVIVPVGSTSAFVDFGAWDGLLTPPTYISGTLQNPSVNHRLKLESSIGTYDSTPQANAPAGVYNVEATFTNVTEVSLENVYFTVADLGTGNVLLNADGSPAGVGAKLSVPAAALGDDGILHTHDTFTFSFAVGLASADLSELTVDANGVPHDWIHPDPAPAYDANNASFVFAVNTANQSIFLPILTR
ncbi:hypothetical protein GC175_32985 [bacterium]|nr:hypothetical protein [bacterium]